MSSLLEMFQEKLKSLDAYDAAPWDDIVLPAKMGIEGAKIVGRYGR